MLEPPDSANRPPAGIQGRPPPEPPAAAGSAAEQVGVAPAGAHQHALVEAIPGVEREGARPDIERDGTAACERGDATGQERDGAAACGHGGLAGRQPDDALGRERDRTGALERDEVRCEHGGASGLIESHPGPGWSHDWLQLSHELRTPLNAILGNIELLLDGSAGPLAAPARACIGDIQTASRQLLHQLQPLLLLVQARTSGALATRMPLDLLALIRQAAADARPDPAPSRPPEPHPGVPRLPGVPCLPGVPRLPECPTGVALLPEAATLMVPGDPIWLGALAAALVDLHAAAPDAKGPLSITLEPCEPGAGGVVLRAAWSGLDPATTSPIPLALIDAVLALHGGRIRAFRGDGLLLDLPGAFTAADGAAHGAR